MKKIFIALAMILVFNGSASAETYSVDPAASGVKWQASKVTGKHDGRINISSGVIVFEEGVFTGGDAVVDVTSLVVDDILDAENNAKLTRHLKSDDFFDAANHPQASIKVTSAEPSAGDVYNVTADVTIKGITKSVTFPATIRKTEKGVEASAAITLDRTDFDIRYGSGKFFENLGDRMIHDTFTLSVSISAA